jgi:hypothetical protein
MTQPSPEDGVTNPPPLPIESLDAILDDELPRYAEALERLGE